jgi:phage gp36-like protein
MSYSTTTDLNNRWGAANIQSWSDLAGAGVPDQNRIAAAMAWADAQIDLHLIGGAYALPLVILDASTRLVVTNWSAVLAGHWLYFSRGLLDKDEQGNKLEDLRKKIEDEITGAQNGRPRLNAQRRWAPNPTAMTAG